MAIEYHYSHDWLCGPLATTQIKKPKNVEPTRARTTVRPAPPPSKEGAGRLWPRCVVCRQARRRGQLDPTPGHRPPPVELEREGSRPGSALRRRDRGEAADLPPKRHATVARPRGAVPPHRGPCSPGPRSPGSGTRSPRAVSWPHSSESGTRSSGGRTSPRSTHGGG